MIGEVLLRAFNALPFSLRYELFLQSGRGLGVESYTVNRGSGPFAGPIWDQTIIKNYLKGGWLWGQAAEMDIINGFFRGRAGTLYDIGANIGIVSIPAAQSGLRVLAFEPDQLNCALLRANIARNCPEADVTVIESAVHREKATLRFARSAHNCGDNYLTATGDYEVAAIPLDSLPLPADPFAVKIDTQGSEPAIFQGGRRTLGGAGMILSEFWPAGMARLGNIPDPILAFVEDWPHGRLIPHQAGPWMSGAELAGRLQAIVRAEDSREHRDGLDFVVAQERF